MTLYLFDYYQGLWKSCISLDPDLACKGAERVLVQRIQMEPTLANVSWLANLMTQYRSDLTAQLSAPEGVVVTVLPEKEFLA